MSALEQMYQQVILDHAKRPVGKVSSVELVETTTVDLKTPIKPTASVEPKTSVELVETTIGEPVTAFEPHCSVGESHQINPTCGDEITLRATVTDGVLMRVSWIGQGCSISQASASVMTELVTGLSLAEVAELDGLFHELMTSRGRGLGAGRDDDEDALGDALAFTGTSRYPARIKCTLLGWAALKDALTRCS